MKYFTRLITFNKKTCACCGKEHTSSTKWYCYNGTHLLGFQCECGSDLAVWGNNVTMESSK